MKLAYIARFEHDWSTETHVARDAEALGITVDRIIPAAGFLDELEERARGADIVVCQTTGLPPDTAAVWARLEAAGVRTASYHLDLYAGLARWSQVTHDPFWRTGTVFTADGDPTTTRKLAELGIRHRWLPAAVVSDETDTGAWRAEYDYDVVFVGSRRYHPEWPWRRELIAHLERRYGDRFAIFDHHPPTRGRDLNDLYATARVVVGDTLALPGHRNFWSDRYYETLGRGGFLIAPYVDGIEAQFTNGEHLVFYMPGDPQHVSDLVDVALDAASFRHATVAAGHAHVAANHTYLHRVQQMLAALDLDDLAVSA